MSPGGVHSPYFVFIRMGCPSLAKSVVHTRKKPAGKQNDRALLLWHYQLYTNLIVVSLCLTDDQSQTP